MKQTFFHWWRRKLALLLAAWVVLAALQMGSIYAFLLDREDVNLTVRAGVWETEPQPARALIPETGDQAGTTLSASVTAEGFSETQNDEQIVGVRGTICVENKGKSPTEDLQILGLIQSASGTSSFEEIHSESVKPDKEPVLGPGKSYCYPYEIIFKLPEAESAGYQIVFDVTVTNHSGWMPGEKECPGPELCPFGPHVKAEFELAALSTLPISDTETPTPVEILPTEPSVTEVPTEPPTEAPSEPPTVEYAPTEPPIEAPTEPPSEEAPPTEAPAGG